MTWIVLKAQAALAMGEMSFTPKPTTTLGCSYTFIAESPLSMLAPNISTLTTPAPE